MRTLLRRKPLQYSVSSLVAVVAIAALASWQQIAADAPASSDEQLAQEVELNVPRLLKVAGRHAYSVEVTLTGKTEEPVAGPIYLVVQGTGVDSLAVNKPDGTTADGEPYFRILPEKKKLSPAKPSTSQTISFKSDGALRSAERREFKLDYRLTRQVAQPKDADRRDDEQPRTQRVAGGRNGGVPTPGRGSDNGRNPRAGDGDQGEPAANDNAREPFELKPEITDREVERVTTIQDKWTPELLKTEGVIGTATAVNEHGDLVIRVYTSRLGIDENLPQNIEGIPVSAKVVGRFRPMYQPPQDKRGRAGEPNARPLRDPVTGLLPMPEPPDVDDPKRRFDRPVPIGVSGINSTLNGCATGTIGCRLVGADGKLFALSNNHVFADSNTAPMDDLILQPGPLDNNCSTDQSNSIGHLVGFVPLNLGFGFGFGNNNNRVDAALAEVTAATLSNSTPEGSYGMPNSHVIPARLGMKVQKMGRTTSYTTGRVTAINASSFVGPYTGGGFGFFVDQIEITKPIIVITDEDIVINFDEFGRPGDSGSLIVSTYGNNPVGLLFAGSVFFTLANRIDFVLDELGETIGQELAIDGAPSNAVPD